MRKASVSMSKRAPKRVHGPGSSRDPTVHGVEDEGDGRQGDEHGRRCRVTRGVDSGPGDEGRDTTGEHRSRQGDAVGRREVTSRGAEEPGGEQQDQGGRAGEAGDPAGDPETATGSQLQRGEQHRHTEEPDERAGRDDLTHRGPPHREGV